MKSGNMKTHQCPDCKNEFVQPFCCTTCGAEKLYDATIISQQETIKLLRELLRETQHSTQYAIIPPGWIARRDAAIIATETF
jgi:hypothetical protein